MCCGKVYLFSEIGMHSFHVFFTDYVNKCKIYTWGSLFLPKNTRIVFKSSFTQVLCPFSSKMCDVTCDEDSLEYV